MINGYYHIYNSDCRIRIGVQKEKKKTIDKKMFLPRTFVLGIVNAK